MSPKKKPDGAEKPDQGEHSQPEDSASADFPDVPVYEFGFMEEVGHEAKVSSEESKDQDTALKKTPSQKNTQQKPTPLKGVTDTKMAGKEDSSEKQAHDKPGLNETETEETKTEEPEKTDSSGNGDLVPPTNSYVPNGSSEDPLDGIDGVLRLQIDDNFLQYASYVIRDRAIPKLDDGLKPVQRRILWSLHRNDDGKFIKVANITGYTMQFHPHGDASINDA